MRGLLPGDFEPSLVTLLSAPIFLLLFVGIIWFVYRRDRKDIYKEYGEIPLKSDQ